MVVSAFFICITSAASTSQLVSVKSQNLQAQSVRYRLHDINVISLP